MYRTGHEYQVTQLGVNSGVKFGVILFQVNHCESWSGSSYECRTAPSKCRPADQLNQLGPRVCLKSRLCIGHHTRS